MIALKVTPTLLESFRWHLDEVFEGYMTKEMILNRIRGKRQYSDRLTIGRAFHRLLEDGSEAFEGTGPVIVRDPDGQGAYQFQKPLVDLVDQYREDSKDCIREVRHEIWFEVGNYKILLRGVLDGLEGLCIRESKTTKMSVTIDNYRDSLQWRCYLKMLPLTTKVIYDVWKLRQNTDGEIEGKYSMFEFLRDDRNDEKIQFYVEKLIQFCEQAGSYGVLRPEWIKQYDTSMIS